MDSITICLIALAILFILAIIIKVANNLIKAVLIGIVVIFVSGMLWTHLSEEQKDDTNDLLNNAKDKITEVSKDIFNKGQENSEVINKIGE